MDFLFDLLFSFVFEFQPSLLVEKGRRPRSPEEQEAMTKEVDSVQKDHKLIVTQLC